MDTAQPTRERRGLLIVLSSPSGAGKSTISRMLLDADKEVTMSVSATTRPMRPGETDGVDYHFVDEAGFDRMITTAERSGLDAPLDTWKAARDAVHREVCEKGYDDFMYTINRIK